jgi:hypothetical protein
MPRGKKFTAEHIIGKVPEAEAGLAALTIVRHLSTGSTTSAPPPSSCSA